VRVLHVFPQTVPCLELFTADITSNPCRCHVFSLHVVQDVSLVHAALPAHLAGPTPATRLMHVHLQLSIKLCNIYRIDKLILNLIILKYSVFILHKGKDETEILV